MPFASTWVDPEGIILSEISQRKTPSDFTYVESKQKNKQNRLIKEMVNRGEGLGTSNLGERN